MVRKKTLFFEARSKELSRIVSLKDVPSARKSVTKLAGMFRKAKTRGFMRRLKSATVLAANRAFAAAKRKNLSGKERVELRKVAEVFRRASKRMVLPNPAKREGLK